MSDKTSNAWNMYTPKYSEWRCYLFGSKQGDNFSFIYRPLEGQVPNWFIRWMMKICLGCTWAKDES